MGIVDSLLGGLLGGLNGGSTGGGTTGGGVAAGGSVTAGGSTSVDANGLLDGLLGGLLGGGGVVGAGSGSGGSTGGGLLDGLISLDLLNENAILGLGILPNQANGGLLQLSLLDPNGDGLVDLSLLDSSVNLSLLDQDGDGLLSLDLLDMISIDLDLDGDIDGDGIPDGSTDPQDYDQVLTGTAGRDAFRIDSSVKTYVDGLGELDIATYVQSANVFDYARTANGVFVSNGDKVDYLQNVERVAFSDGMLALDTGVGENTGFAYRIYQAAFDRTPDAAGLNYWIDALDDGKSMGQVAADFLYSREFQATYGTLSNTDFIEELYENVLQRAGESAGINYWVDRLEDGTGRAEVLAGFTDSAENVELVGAVIAGGVFLAA